MRLDTKIINKKINIYLIITTILFMILIIRLFFVMIIENNDYKEKLKVLSYNNVEKNTAPRGRIYDRNYNIIVDNIRVNSIYYKKERNITKKEEIENIKLKEFKNKVK